MIVPRCVLLPVVTSPIFKTTSFGRNISRFLAPQKKKYGEHQKLTEWNVQTDNKCIALEKIKAIASITTDNIFNQ